MDLDTIRGLQDWLDANGFTVLARQLKNEWCWQQVAAWAKTAEIPTELWDMFITDLVATCDGYWCFDYLRHVGHNDEVLATLIAFGDPPAIYWYLEDCGHRDDVVAALVASGSAMYLFLYLRDIGHRDDVLAAFIAAGSVYWFACYLTVVGHRDDVAEALAKLKS